MWYDFETTSSCVVRDTTYGFMWENVRSIRRLEMKWTEEIESIEFPHELLFVRMFSFSQLFALSPYSGNIIKDWAATTHSHQWASANNNSIETSKIHWNSSPSIIAQLFVFFIHQPLILPFSKVAGGIVLFTLKYAVICERVGGEVVKQKKCINKSSSAVRTGINVIHNFTVYIRSLIICRYVV